MGDMSDDDPCPDCWQLVLEKQELRDKLARLRAENELLKTGYTIDSVYTLRDG